MNIRLAKEKDAVDIVSLCQEHAIYEEVAYCSRNKLQLIRAHFFSSDHEVKCIVVEHHKKLVGYATFMKQFSTWDAGYYIYLDCLFLKKHVRGKGLGTKIMERLKEYARSENCKVIQWQTPVFNKKAIEFYLKTGATSTSKERFFLNI